VNGFFDPVVEAPFVMFSLPHLASVLLCGMLMIGMFVYRKQIRANPRLKNALRYSIAAVLIVLEGGLHIWYAVVGVWDARDSLPLELCSISLLLSIVMLFTRSRLLYQLMLFAGIGGAMQAVLTPNLYYPFPHFRFFHFFLAHIAIILAPLYLTWIEKYRPTWRSVGYAMIFLNVLLVFVGGIDLLLDANYMFLMGKPNTPSLLDYLGEYPYYLIVEEGVALLIFILMYVGFFRIPEWVRERKERQRSSS